ncbi:hypothetical protein [Streptomyces sp. NPDC052042]|uniref:hypothetical protein n=1 Tax=Streptomyces sp. NPDC052042 TaxID=3365683 RepID=UPI0037D6B9EB
MAHEQEIRVGQVWRRKKNGRHIRIVRERAGLHGPSDDWAWEGEDYRGRGVSYGSYIRRDCEPVKEAS